MDLSNMRKIYHTSNEIGFFYSTYHVHKLRLTMLCRPLEDERVSIEVPLTLHDKEITVMHTLYLQPLDRLHFVKCPNVIEYILSCKYLDTVYTCL